MSAFSARPFRAAVLTFASFAFLAVEGVRGQEGSAVITLVMPVGARQLGMGESGVALADDVYGTYWNPGGLAFGPVANEWQVMLPRTYEHEGVKLNHDFTALVTRPRTGFLTKSEVWAGAKDGLVFYDGKNWRSNYEYVMEQGDKVEAVVRRYAGSGKNLDSLVARVKRYNHLKTAKDEADLLTLRLPYNLLFPDQTVTALALDNTDRLWVGTPIGLFRFDGQSWKSFDEEDGFTYITDTTAATAADAMDTPDSTAVKPDTSASARPDSTARADSLGKTADSTRAAAASADTAAKKSPYRQLAITALAVKGTSVWIGTNDGLYEYEKSSIVRRGADLLPTQSITSIATHPDVDEVYVGLLHKGVARYRAPRIAGAPAKWRLFTVADGLLDSNVTEVVLDKYGHVYAVHPGGVSHFNLRDWERYRFPQQKVRGVAVDEDNHVWIATSEGAWKLTPAYSTPRGRLLTARDTSAQAERKGIDLVHFHVGNGLSNDDVSAVQTEGGDIWFLTGGGIERYNRAKSQVGFFYESLLPVLNLQDLYHAFMGATFPIEEWGTLGGFVNYVSFGQNLQTTADGSTQSNFDAYELVADLTYSTRLSQNAGLGVNAKFIYSALSQGVTSSGEKSDGIAASYAVDLGFLQHNLGGINGLSLGVVMQNMGPAVFYVDQAQSDPIPFTWKIGLAYNLISTPNHRLTVETDANREAFYRYGDQAAPVWIGAWKELVYPGGSDQGYSVAETWMQNLRRTVYDMGAEYVYAKVVALRAGYLYDQSGQRYEGDLGLGFMLSDILQIDGTFIKSFNAGIRNDQKRFSMILRF